MWRQWNAYPDVLVKVVLTTAGDTLFSRLAPALPITIIYNIIRATLSSDQQVPIIRLYVLSVLL